MPEGSQFRADRLTGRPTLWELGTTSKDNTSAASFRPYTATDQESRALTANLRARHAAVGDTPGQLLG